MGMLPCPNLHTTSCIRILFSSTAPGKLYFEIGRCEQDSNGRIYNKIRKKGQDTSIAGMADLSVSSVRILAQASRK